MKNLFPSFFKNDDYKVVAHNLCCIIDGLPLTGTLMQQNKAWDLYLKEYSMLKRRYVDG